MHYNIKEVLTEGARRKGRNVSDFEHEPHEKYTMTFLRTSADVCVIHTDGSVAQVTPVMTLSIFYECF